MPPSVDDYADGDGAVDVADVDSVGVDDAVAVFHLIKIILISQ